MENLRKTLLLLLKVSNFLDQITASAGDIPHSLAHGDGFA